MDKKQHRSLQLYCGVLTIGLVASLLMGASAQQSARFDTLDVGRINIREPDGTLRMVIANRTQFPGGIVQGKEHPHPRLMAGMLFYNDEGTENGGLIFNGRRQDGKVGSGLSLTFDRYQQDQQLQLLGVDEGGQHFAGMTVNDVPDGVQHPVFAPGTEAAFRSGDIRMVRRVYVGKTPGASSVLQLADAAGKTRLQLVVTPEGQALIQFKDVDGKVTRTLAAEDITAK